MAEGISEEMVYLMTDRERAQQLLTTLKGPVRLGHSQHSFDRGVEQILHALADAEAQGVAEGREALEFYGNHTDTCEWYVAYHEKNRACTCGWNNRNANRPASQRANMWAAVADFVEDSYRHHMANGFLPESAIQIILQQLRLKTQAAIRSGKEIP
mgnify:CR=1 FL=1